MDKKELFDKAALLLEKLNNYRKTSVLVFNDMDEKLMLKDVYNSIYPSVNVQLGCTACVLQYLNMLQAWYEREFPLYVQSIQPINSLDATGLSHLVQPIKSKGKKKK